MRKFKVKNDLKLSKRIAFAVLFFAVFLLCISAVTIPPENYYIEKSNAQDNDVVATFGSGDIFYCNSCVVEEGGKVSITGDDAYIVLSTKGLDFSSVALNFSQPVSTNFSCDLYYDVETNFSEAQIVRKMVFPGDNDVCYDLPDTEIGNIRIDIDTSYYLNNIELHATATFTTKRPIEVSSLRYAFVLFSSLGFLVVFLLFDTFIYPVSQKITEWLRKSSKSIIAHIILICCAVVASAVLELILSKRVFSGGSLNSAFNPYRFFFLACLLSTIAVFALYLKDKAIEIERLFVLVVIFAGISLILCAPFGHISWDYDSHSRFVLDKSYIGTDFVTRADNMAFFTEDFYLSRDNAADNNLILEKHNAVGQEVVGVQGETAATVAHIPAGLASAIVRFMELPYVLSVMAGRFANVIVYALVCYFAIKKLSSGKMILATIALFPTNIFLAANYSYDYWVTSFIMLGTAYYVEELKNQDQPAKIKDTIIMCGAFALGCLPKQIYMPVMILPFFVFKKWENKKQRNRYLAVCALMFVFMMSYLMYRSLGEVAKGGDMRGGDVNPAMQIAAILGNPLQYAKTLIIFLKTYLSVSQMGGYITSFAYFGIGPLVWVYIALVMITTLTDKNGQDKFKGMHITRALNILLFLGIICLVATALYVAYTPVGLDTIKGCQARYIVPILLPLLLTVANRGLVFKFDKRFYNTAIMLILTFCMYYNVYTVMLQRLF